MDPETSLEEGSSKVNPLFHLDEDATKPLQLLGHKRILGGWLETTVNENSKSKVIKKCSKNQNQLARPTIQSGILFSIPTIGRASEQVREEAKPKENIFKETKPEVQEDMTVKRPNNTRESDPSSNATGGESEKKYLQTDQLNQILSGYLKNSNGKNWHEAELCDTVLRLRHARQEALLAAKEASEIREETLAAKRDALKARKEATQALTEVFKARQETAEAIEEISDAKMRMSVMLRLSEEHLNSSKAQKDEKDKCNSSFKRSTKKSSLTAQKRARKTKSSEGNETIIIPTSLGLTPSCSKTPGLMATEPHVSTIQTKQNWDHIEHLPSSPKTFPKVGASPESQKSLGVSVIGRLKQSSDIEQNCSDKTGLNNSSLIQPSTTKCKDFVDLCDKTEDSVAIMESDSDSDDSEDTSEDAMQNSPVA